MGGGKCLHVQPRLAGGLTSALWLFYFGAVWFRVGCLLFMLSEVLSCLGPVVVLPSPCRNFIRLCSCFTLLGAVVVLVRLCGGFSRLCGGFYRLCGGAFFSSCFQVRKFFFFLEVFLHFFLMLVLSE